MERPVTANDLNCAIGEVLMALGAASKSSRMELVNAVNVVAYLRDTMRRAASVADALGTQWAEAARLARMAAKQAEEGTDA